MQPDTIKQTLSKTNQHHHLLDDHGSIHFFLALQEQFTLNITSIIVSNLHVGSADRCVYICRATRDDLSFVEKHKAFEQYIRYDFASSHCYLNDEQMSSFFKESFFKRLEQVTNDLKSAQAEIYNETL